MHAKNYAHVFHTKLVNSLGVFNERIFKKCPRKSHVYHRRLDRLNGPQATQNSYNRINVKRHTSSFHLINNAQLETSDSFHATLLAFDKVLYEFYFVANC